MYITEGAPALDNEGGESIHFCLPSRYFQLDEEVISQMATYTA